MVKEMSEEKKETTTLEKILVQIGPYGLIAVCITLIVNVASKPLDSNSWVSIGILVVVILISFLFDWLRMKSSAEIQKIRINAQTELEKHKSWEETTKPMIESSSMKGQIRMESFKVLHAIYSITEEDLKKDRWNKDQKIYCQDLTERLKDLEKAIMML
jgi:membrane protein insertase Oxa1/YidC/SpoIIIJ